MVWQQWVLLIWYLLRIPFIVNGEITKERPEVSEEHLNRAISIGICTWLFVAGLLIALVVTI